MTRVVVAPFTNSDVRDWPAAHYRDLIGHLVDAIGADVTVRVVGTASQRSRAAEIVRPFAYDRVTNECGRRSWAWVVGEIEAAACVVGNNSGVTHLAGSLGVPTVCIFGGSHQRLEWRPLGFDVLTISRSIGCSPCHLDRVRNCPYDVACLRKIDPEAVAGATLRLIERVAERRKSAAEAPALRFGA